MAFLLAGGLVLGAIAGIGALLGSKTVASNIANETVQAMLSVTNDAISTCMVDTSQFQGANVTKNKDSTIDLNLNWSQVAVLKANCTQDVQVQNKVNQAILQEAEQISKSIAQQFQLSASEAKNVVNTTTNLAIRVSNSFIQTCSAGATQVQNLNINENTHVSVNVFANWSQYNQSVVNCVMKDKAVTDATQAVQQTVDQKSTATVENFFATVFGAVFAIFAVIGIIIFSFLFFRPSGRGGGTSQVTVVGPAEKGPSLSELELASRLSEKPAATATKVPAITSAPTTTVKVPPLAAAKVSTPVGGAKVSL
jgi:hypothetical protein